VKGQTQELLQMKHIAWASGGLRGHGVRIVGRLAGAGNIVPVMLDQMHVMSDAVPDGICVLTTLTQDVKARFVREELQRIPL